MPNFKYMGNGEFLHGVPSRDLTAEEADKIGVEKLRKHNLYQEVKSSKISKKKEVVKDVRIDETS